MTIRQRCFEHMGEAYERASAGGTFPAPARQVAYALRVLTGLGDELKLDYVLKGANYSGLLDAYMTTHPDECADWDVVRDDRGDLTTPTGHQVALGTLAVRDEEARLQWWNGIQLPAASGFGVATDVPMRGPGDEYSAVVYIEKQGFDPMLQRSGFVRRRNVAVMSSKGYSVRAAHRLAGSLAELETQVYVVHDLDKQGLGIGDVFLTKVPGAIDLGLRWDDVIDPRWGPDGGTLLDLAERVTYGRSSKGPTDPLDNLIDRRASDDEIALLRQRVEDGQWVGQRVELNALIGQQFIDWLDSKLTEHGHERCLPDVEHVADAYRRSWAFTRVNDAVAEAWAIIRDEAVALNADDVRERIIERMEADPEASWGDVIQELIEDDLNSGDHDAR